MALTNPAARLHEILTRAQASLSQPNQTSSAISVWLRVFEIPEQRQEPFAGAPEYLEVISRLLQLRQLVSETEEQLRAIDGLPEKYFKPFPRIRAIPEQSLMLLNADVAGTIRALTEGDMTVLDFCSDRLEELHAETVINEDELQDILMEVSVLFDEVKTSGLHPELQSFILDGLESIRRAIFEYRIRGPQRLKEEIAHIVGNLATNQHLVRADDEDEETQQKLGQFGKLFYRLAAVVSFASDSVALLAAAKVGLLPGGG